jgi:hypothetical protein
MDNPFIGLDAATLTTLKSEAVACLSAILKNQSYSLNGRNLTRANLNDVTTMLGQLQGALDVANGTTAQTTYVSFTGNGGSW